MEPERLLGALAGRELFWRLLGSKGVGRIRLFFLGGHVASKPAFRYPPARPGPPRGPPRAPFWVIFGPPSSILGAKNATKMEPDALPHQRKRNPTKKTENFIKISEQGPKQTKCRCPFSRFFFFFLHRASGLLPPSQGWWGRAKRIE